MSAYLYDNYIVALSERFLRGLEDIGAYYNFDFGDEFEIAICQILRSFLPAKYGICRGFAVAANGDHVGDDIIIFDQTRFPTLRLIERNEFSRKEKIPIGAIYGYIEVKHRLELSSDPSSSLQKGLAQVKSVKTLCNTRAQVPLNAIDPYWKKKPVVVAQPNIYPSRNPTFTMVIAREGTVNGKHVDDALLSHRLDELLCNDSLDAEMPEAIVVGANHYLAASLIHDGNLCPNQFILPGVESRYNLYKRERLAPGMGLVHLMASLDWMRLDAMPWVDIFNNAKNLRSP